MTLSETVVPEDVPIAPETVRLPQRGFTIDRGKALLAAAVLCSEVALRGWLGTIGRS
jgi:undecaprenyl-diphosphatase